MIMFHMLIAAAASTLVASPPALDRGFEDDVRCFILSNAFAKHAKDPKGKQMAVFGLTYYSGRLDSKAGPVQIATAVRKMEPLIDSKNAGAIMNACVARMVQSQHALTDAMKAQAAANSQLH